MGSMVGAAARANGLRVLWASDGRGGQTAARAASAGLEDVKTLAPLAASSQIILSVCPPHAAVDLARLVMGKSFTGIYVDGNAVSPATAREIAKIVTGGGATFVDGGIIGPPPKNRGTTRMYLSGAEAGRVARLFEQGALEVIAIEGGPGAASALKMAYAAYTSHSRRNGRGASLVSASARRMRPETTPARRGASRARWPRSRPPSRTR